MPIKLSLCRSPLRSELDIANPQRENNGMLTVATRAARPAKATGLSRRPTSQRRTYLLACMIFGTALAAWSQASDSTDTNQSWTSVTQSHSSAVNNQTRTTSSHTQSGNRTIDKQSTQILRSGTYEPYQDIERESTKVDNSTTRTVVRTYGRDANGQRVLVQLTDDEEKTLPSGGSKVVRSTSNPDPNGNLLVVQRQVQETTKLEKNVEETKTTTYLPNINGGLTPSMQVQERRERVDDHTVQFQKSTLLPDGAGNWQAGEVKTGTIMDAGANRSSEEHVLRPDSEGHLSEVSRTLSKESQSASGENRSTVEIYSKDVPGASPDGSLHLVQRVTTRLQASSSGGQATQQQVEQINPGNPSRGLQITVQSSGSKEHGSSGTRENRTFAVRDADGHLDVVSVDMTKSDQAPPVQVQIAPPAKPK